MDAIEEQLSQISLDQQNVKFEFNEDKKAEMVVRASWKADSILEIYSNTKKCWFKGTVTQLLPHIPINNAINVSKTESLLPHPILNIDYKVDNVLHHNRVHRNCQQIVRPNTDDIEHIKHKNKTSFQFFRNPKHDFIKLTQIKNNVLKQYDSNNPYYKALTIATDLMKKAQKNKDNWLTPKCMD